jgi:uncharacterized membrane protein YhaH (DUF805 family)
MTWYIKVLKSYAVFTGRASRQEFWMFCLFSSVVSTTLTVIDVMTGIINDRNLFGINTLYSLAVMLPSLGVSIRRLHDTGRSGWKWLLGLIPFVGPVLLLVFFCQDSQPQANEYGPNPKADVSPDVPESAAA